MDISNESIYNLEWDLLKLEELGEFERGKSKHRPRHDSILFGGSYPFIQTGEIKAANYKITKFEKTYNEKGLSQSKLWSKNTLCITIAANIAETAILDIEACFPDSVVGFIPKLDNMDSYFMHYVFTYMRKKIQSSVSGSVQDNINIAYLKKLKFRVPKIEKRKKIVSVLKSLDDKIEINNEMNKTLEEMAQTLFKRWFIDFDFPNENEEPYKSSGGKMVDSELGEIPEGWEVNKLGNLFKFIKGKKPKIVSEICSEETPLKYLTIKGFNGDENLYASEDKTILIDKKDIVMVMDGASSGDVYIGKSGVLGSTFSKIEKIKEINWSYIYLILKYYENDIKSHTTGSAIPHTDKGYVEKIKISLPNLELLNFLSAELSGLIKRKLINQQEIQSLTEIRDILLPKLMSGEIEV